MTPRLREIFGADTRSLGLFRIALGVLVLLDLAQRAPLFGALYGAAGVFPESFVGYVNPGWHEIYFPFLVADSSAALTALAFATAACALALLLGYRTWTSLFLTWFLRLSLHTRNPLAASFEDDVLLLLLFWGLFLPLGARYSLDARRGRGAVVGPIYSGGSVALFVQFGAIYFFTGLLKTGPEWHAEGNALYYTLSQNYFARPLAAWLLEYPSLIAFLTRATYFWELSIGAVFLLPIWNGPARTLGVASVWAFHTGIALTLSIGLFPYTMMAGSLALLPPWFWERLVPRLARGRAKPAAPAPAPAQPTPVPDPLKLAKRLGRDALPVLVLSYVLLFDVSDWLERPWLPAAAERVGATFHLNRAWRMYAPQPEKFDYFYVMRARLENGDAIDPLRGGAPMTLDPPGAPPWQPTPRPWHVYLDHVRAHSRVPGLTLALAAWTCAGWNTVHAEDERIVTLDWVMVRTPIAPDAKTRRDLIGSWVCAEGLDTRTHSRSHF